MRMITHTFKWFAGLALACMVGALSSCGTMGGGGMKYLVDPPAAVARNA